MVTTRPRSVLVLARHDSFLKAGLCHAQSFACEGAQVDVIIVSSRGAGLSVKQAGALGLSKVPRAQKLSQLCRREVLEAYDLVLLGLDGRHSRYFLQKFYAAFALETSRRPVVAAYYPGILFRFHLEGMQSRMSADLVLLNSVHDCELYGAMLQGLGVAESNGIAVGLSYVGPPQPARSDGDAIVFFGQPTVPPGIHERAYLVEQLVAVAQRHPSHRVILKPRHRPGERTLHRDRFHFDYLVASYASRYGLPTNFHLSYAPVGELLVEAASALTISSTAALEALACGVPTHILTDFGIHENLGNHFFLGSGLFATFEEIRPDMPCVVESTWSRTHIKPGIGNEHVLVSAVGSLLQQRSERGELPLRTKRLLGRSRSFREFADREFGPAALAEFDARRLRGSSLAWLGHRLRATVRRVVGREGGSV